MKELRYTLLSDGTSDRALLPCLTWLLREYHVECAIHAEWADLQRLPHPPKTLSSRIKMSVELYPCDLLFVHRDAEKEPRQVRVAQILEAVDEASISSVVPPAVCVVPVRMLETWLLFDEPALRRVAGNPHGQQPLKLPPVAKLEKLPNPKTVLYTLFKEASGLEGRRRKRVPVHRYVGRIADLIDDFAPLRALPAFKALEADMAQVIKAHGWNSSP